MTELGDNRACTLQALWDRTLGVGVPGGRGEKRGGSRSGGRSLGCPHGSGASAARVTGVPSAVAAGLGPGGHSARPGPCWGLLRGGADAPAQDFKFCDVLGVAAGAEVAPLLRGGLTLARLTGTGSRTGRQPAISRGGAGGPGDHAAPGSCPGEGWPGPQGSLVSQPDSRCPSQQTWTDFGST